MNYEILLDLAIIIVFAKGFGIVARYLKAPQVVGQIVAGLVIGPCALGLVDQSEFLIQMAEIGVILLMFSAGLETNLRDLMKTGLKALAIACAGVLVPLVGGTLLYMGMYGTSPLGSTGFYKAVFIGVIMTATSVSITVEALREMGKLDGKVGNAILGAAVLDDIIGIIVLTIVSSFKDTSVSVGLVLMKIVAYVILMCIIGALLLKFKPLIDRRYKKQSITTYALAACFIISFVSEEYFGVASITGAYLLGLFLSTHKIKLEVEDKVRRPSYLFFSPIFFASVGLKVELDGLTKELLLFSLVLLIIAILTKVMGCGLGARLCNFSARESLQIGVGMVSRGEVALIVAQKGYAMGLMPATLFPPIILVVIATTILPPIILKKIMT